MRLSFQVRKRIKKLVGKEGELIMLTKPVGHQGRGLVTVTKPIGNKGWGTSNVDQRRSEPRERRRATVTKPTGKQGRGASNGDQTNREPRDVESQR